MSSCVVTRVCKIVTGILFEFRRLTLQYRDRGSTVVKVLCYKSEGHWFELKFFIDIKPFRSHYGPGVDSASNIDEYQEYFLGVKAAGA